MRANMYWIAIEEERGATNDDGDDYYLNLWHEWRSRDSKTWEKQNGRVEVFSTGSVEPNSYSNLDDAADSLEDKSAADYIRNNVLNADPIFSAVVWAVDDAGIRRSAYAEEFEGLPDDMIEMINLCDQGTDDEVGLKTAAAFCFAVKMAEADNA